MTTHAFPLDAGLPEFATACDPRRMTELLRRHLRPRGDARIEACTLEEFRYRPEKRSVLRYRLSLSGAPGRSAWATGALYRAERAPGRARAIADRIGGEPVAGPEWDQPFEPVAFLPELEMVVQVYPFDRRLPALRVLADGPTPELAEELARSVGAGGAAGHRWTSERIRYRAELCAVFRHTLHTAGGGTHRFYVKLYPKTEDLAVEARLAAFGGRIGDFAVPRVVAVLPGLNVIALSEVPGTPLDRLLASGDGTVTAARAVGRSLAGFNLGAALPQRRFTPSDEVTGLRRAATMLRWARPHLGAAIDKTVGHIAEALQDVDVAPAATHRDLKLDHVLLHGGRPALVDMDSCAAADPVLDPATLLARMYSAPLEQAATRHDAQAAMRAFAEAYFEAVPAAWRERLGAHYAGALLETGVSMFRRQVSGWPAALEALAGEAQRSIAR